MALFRKVLNAASGIYAKYGFYAYIFVFIAFFLTIFLLQNIFLALSSHLWIIQEEKRQDSAKKASEDSYREILEKQSSAPKSSPVIPVPSRILKGHIPVSVILVKPPALSDNEIRPLISVLQDPRYGIFSTCTANICEKNISLSYIKTFIAGEARKYGTENTDISINVHGVYTLSDLTKIGDFANPWNKDPFGVARVQDDFESLLKGIDGDSNISIFLYFDNSWDTISTVSDSLYDEKKFRSFANEEKGRAYVNVYTFSPLFAKSVTLVVTHELLHLFGASDKYIENPVTGKICSQKGLGDPARNALYPQVTGDIMCLYIEKNNGNFTRGSLTDNNLVINKFTAGEIGWIQ